MLKMLNKAKTVEFDSFHQLSTVILFHIISYYRTLTGNHRQAIEWYQFR